MKPVSRRPFATALAGIALMSGGRAQDIDYEALLPPIPPQEPAEALESFQVADGLKIERVAAEPLIRDPMAIAFDERGRLYVVEFSEYNQRWAEGGLREGDHGRVKLLEDTDGDGRMDQSTIFADELDFASAVICWDGGIFLGMAPDILFLKDTDGDGKADHREVVLTGFSREVNRAGQAPLNSFRWGLDNRIHVSTNFSGGAIRSTRNPDAPPLTVRNRDILFDPRTGEFEATSGGGQHGMSFDDWGRKFVCRNSEPIKMIFYDDRYLANNPYLSAPSPAVDITEHGKYTKLFSISSEEPWRILRTRLRAEKKYRGSTEGPGGKPAVSGYFTASTGVTIYRGDALPDEFRGDVFTGEAANNLVYRAKLEPDRVGLKAVRATPESEGEFLASTDNWFRPVQLANGPDGALYIVDMYRFLIEGGAFLPPEALKYMDVRGGVDRGRIYRIVPETGIERERRQIDLSSATSGDLAALLEHRNAWHRETAARLLYGRQDRSVIPELVRMARNSGSPVGRIQALSTLAGMEALEAPSIGGALDDENPQVRRHGLRLAESISDEKDRAILREIVISLLEDSNVGVRYQAAFSLGALQGESDETAAALANLLIRSGADPWIRLAVFSAIREEADSVLTRLLLFEKFRKSDTGESILLALARLVGRGGDPESVGRVAETIIGLGGSDQVQANRLLKSLLTSSRSGTRESLLARGGGEVAAMLEDLVARAMATAFDPKAKPPGRISAIRMLEFAKFGEIESRISDLLEPDQPVEVRSAAIQVLAEFDDESAGKLLIDAWPALSPQARSQALDTLLSRPAWAIQCLEAVSGGVIGRGELGPARTKQLREFPDAKVREKSAEVLLADSVSSRAEVIEKYRPALDLEGDFEKGRAVFQRACVACHRLENVGVAIGANLQGIGKSGAESILLNILDPNRDVKPDFLIYTVSTKSGQIHGGMIRSESANSLTLRRLDGTDVSILRVDVNELNGLGISFMPEGLEAQITVEEMADLVRYLEEVE